MPTAADLQPAAGYDERWVWLAVASVVAAVLWFVLVRVATRERRPPAPRRATARAACLAELHAIEQDTAAGRLPARAAHQRVSRTVRAYVEQTSAVPAGTMTLASLREEGHERLADVVAVLYPPEFAPGDDRAVRDLPDALRRARDLVTSWT